MISWKRSNVGQAESDQFSLVGDDWSKPHMNMCTVSAVRVIQAARRQATVISWVELQGRKKKKLVVLKSAMAANCTVTWQQ